MASARRFENKVVVVTGSARPPGMGWATAQRLADEGATVICVDRVATGGGGTTDAAEADVVAALQESLRSRGARCAAIDADVTVAGKFETVVDRVVAEFGRIDACCCLNGTSGANGGSGDVATLTTESWTRCIEVNLTAPFLVATAAARHMIGRGGAGAITLLSSYAALQPSPTAGAIGAARAGLNFLVASLAIELGPHGIRVNAVAPLGVAAESGPLRNTGLDALIAKVGGATNQAEWARGAIPLGRPQEAAETAAVFAFLSSDDASFVSGECIAVAGGAPV